MDPLISTVCMCFVLSEGYLGGELNGLNPMKLPLSFMLVLI